MSSQLDRDFHGDTAVPAVESWLVTTAPEVCAIADREESRNAGLSVSGLLMRTSLSPDPKREAIGRDGHDAVGRQRFGNVTFTCAWPF
jgi:hypothetical protein